MVLLTKARCILFLEVMQGALGQLESVWRGVSGRSAPVRSALQPEAVRRSASNWEVAWRVVGILILGVRK